jgi:hypothetical protein
VHEDGKLLDHVGEDKDVVSLLLILLCAGVVGAFGVRRRDRKLYVRSNFLWDSRLGLAAVRRSLCARTTSSP